MERKPFIHPALSSASMPPSYYFWKSAVEKKEVIKKRGRKVKKNNRPVHNLCMSCFRRYLSNEIHECPLAVPDTINPNTSQVNMEDID